MNVSLTEIPGTWCKIKSRPHKGSIQNTVATSSGKVRDNIWNQIQHLSPKKTGPMWWWKQPTVQQNSIIFNTVGMLNRSITSFVSEDNPNHSASAFTNIKKHTFKLSANNKYYKLWPETYIINENISGPQPFLIYGTVKDQWGFVRTATLSTSYCTVQLMVKTLNYYLHA